MLREDDGKGRSSAALSVRPKIIKRYRARSSKFISRSLRDACKKRVEMIDCAQSWSSSDKVGQANPLVSSRDNEDTVDMICLNVSRQR